MCSLRAPPSSSGTGCICPIPTHMPCCPVYLFSDTHTHTQTSRHAHQVPGPEKRVLCRAYPSQPRPLRSGKHEHVGMLVSKFAQDLATMELCSIVFLMENVPNNREPYIEPCLANDISLLPPPNEFNTCTSCHHARNPSSPKPYSPHNLESRHHPDNEIFTLILHHHST